MACNTVPLAAVISGGLTSLISNFTLTTADLALYINAISFLFCAYTVWRLREIPPGPGKAEAAPSIGKSLWDGFKFIKESKVIGGLIFGMLGAFFAAGAVIGLARTFVGDLSAGDAAYGILFGSVFSGLS